VDATPGQAITKGTVLATADAGDAQLALTVAKANLAAAEAKLSSDRAGLSSTDRAAAALSVTQAQQSLSQARTAQSQTIAQNKLKVTQQSQAVSAAARKLADDTAAGADAVQIAQDQAAVTQARNALASLRLQVTQSNAQAANQVRSAQLQVQSAKLGFASRTAGATDAQIASDEAAVATARQSVDAAQTRVEGAALTSPVDGVVLTVNIAPGADAPSGAAITLQADTFAVSASVAESDLPSLVLGQAADITITATKAAATGVVTQISPAGSAGTGGGVVSYAITVSLPTPPKGTASGMSAQVSITTASAPGVLAVPSIALVTSGDGYAVRVLDGSGQPQAIPVEVGLITSSLAEIQGGIAEGTEVVVGTTSTRTGTTNPAGGFGGGFGGGGGGFPGGGTRGGG
jgi:multidrug efflux pump subunit AcrA (membrane-fusion protein)